MSRFLRLAIALLPAILAGLLFPAQTLPAEQIVIRGAGSGSSLELSVSGDRIVVHGYLAPGGQAGCQVTRARIEAICPTAGAAAIELRMGPSGDFVQVLETLPVPLIAYLGGGSDKLVANGERDTCYPGGARRNRCVLGPGDDVCITGNDNSDCVGGAGDDYCRHGNGSDGCWGGPGDDVCVMGAGQDGCHGNAGNDTLYGGPNPDQLYGGPGTDFCDGGPGWGKSHTCERGPGR